MTTLDIDNPNGDWLRQRFPFQGVLDGAVASSCQRGLGQPRRQRCARCDGAGDGERMAGNVVRQRAHQAQAHRFRTPDGAAGEQQVACGGDGRDLREQPGRGHPWMEPERGERHGHPCFRRCVAQVAGQGHRQAGATAAPLMAAIVGTSRSRIASQSR